MSGTTELRALLDERGVEYFKHEDGEPLRKLEKSDDPATSWRMGGASVCAVPIEGSDLFALWIDHCTPEQAIEATTEQMCEIVRCRDCKHLIAHGSGCEYWDYCDIESTDGFCAWGERKSEGE